MTSAAVLPLSASYSLYIQNLIRDARPTC